VDTNLPNITTIDVPLENTKKYFSGRKYENLEQFWDNQALLPGYQGVVPDDENNTSTNMLYSFLLNHINLSNEVILDVGCGVGRLFPAYQQDKAKEIHGVDISSQMLRRARHKFPESNVFLYQHSITDLSSFPVDKFSLIVCVTTLCHVLEQEGLDQAINSMLRVLAPKGHLLICEPMSINVFKLFKHSNMIIRPIVVYSSLLQGMNKVYNGYEWFGPLDHVDSKRYIIVARKD